MKVLRAILAAGLLVLGSSPGFSGEHVGKRQDPIKAPCIPNKNYLKPAEEQPEQPAEEQPEQPPKETPEQPATVLRKMKPTSKERASSSWTVCNRLGKGPVEVAYIVKIDGNWHHKGWRSIPVGQCELLQEKLETDTVYFHAQGPQASPHFYSCLFNDLTRRVLNGCGSLYYFYYKIPAVFRERRR
jgi:hypothetical protein